MFLKLLAIQFEARMSKESFRVFEGRAKKKNFSPNEVFSDLPENQETFLADGGEEVGEEQRVLVLGPGHHVEKLVTRWPDFLEHDMSLCIFTASENTSKASQALKLDQCWQILTFKSWLTCSPGNRALDGV